MLNGTYKDLSICEKRGGMCGVKDMEVEGDRFVMI